MNRMIALSLVLSSGLCSLPSPSKAAEPQASKPRVWAIVVGIDRYDDALIPACSGAVRDARMMAEWFAETAGWGRGQVLRMDHLGRRTHGPASESITELRPTKANLDWAVVDWLGHRVKKDDIVVLYFAGQATSRPPRDSNRPGRTVALPIDARAADLDATGWSIDQALDQSRALAANKARVVLWLDTSPSGRGLRGFTTEKGSPTGADWLRSLTRWPGVTAWLAADGRPLVEGTGATTGPFVTSVLKGLGNGDQAHNLLGCLKALNDDHEMTSRGFRTMGGVGPAVSLWSGGARVVEEVVPELIIQAGHGAQVTSVLVTADNAHAITSSEDSTVRVWSLADRSLIRVLTDPLVGVEAMALDRDGEVLMAGDGIGRIFGWDMTRDRPKPFYGPPEHTEGIADIAFLPESKRFVTRDRSQKSFLWDGAEGAIRKLGAFSDEPISQLASSPRPEPTGAAIVAGVEARDGKPGAILTFDASAKQTSRLDWAGGRISTLDLANDGRKIAVGDAKGTVRVLDLPGGKVSYEARFDGKVQRLWLSKSGLLLVADSRSLRLVEPKAGAIPTTLTDPEKVVVGGQVDRSSFSNDGRWLVSCTPEGRVLAWRLGEGSRAEPFALPQGENQGLSPAFSPDGRTLLVGDADGGLRSWTLPEAANPGPAESRPTILPARGKVASLVPSPSGRYLLEITSDDIALIWDLKEGRGCNPLPGRWIGGAFLPDESKLVLAKRPDQGGDLVRFDRNSNTILPTRFERPQLTPGQPSNTAFVKLVVSKSGKWVASASLEGQEPLACVWSAETGKLVHFVRDHDGGLTGVDLSEDETQLLTASQDGTVKLWPLADVEIELRKAVVILSNPDGEVPIVTAARLAPGKTSRVVMGTRGGFVFLWDLSQGAGKPKRFDLGRLDGSINAATFSSDGRWVAASSSRDKSVRFWSIPDAGPPVAVGFTPRPHHAEQVGALAGWPGGSMIVSGGDDTAVRFWDLKDHALIGTLVAQSRDEKAVEWLAFTPEGLFDGSLPGEAMVKWRVGSKIVTLQQSQDIHHVFQLAGAFPIGEKIKAPSLKDDSPRLKIDAPGEDRLVDRREVELTVWTGDANPNALRLYQNGVPIKGPGDFEPGSGPNFLKTRVTLRRGDNAFYAMASKPGAIDGQTETRTLRYEGPDPPGRVHTIAIGVSDYSNRPLQYAHTDARSIADFLDKQQKQANLKPGEQVILVNNDVTVANIESAFRRIRDAVKGRPQDTVVLFLAGHTDTDTKNEQFCLLLPEFPFDGAPPLDPKPNDDPLRVATRGNIGGSSFSTRVGEPGVLPYVVLYNRLARLEALQRLIIIDACQAAAILEDPAVRNIQRLVEKGSRNARNSYLLAARRGEPANEADALKHGLLTYTLLHGLKAPGLVPIPEALGGFPGGSTADLNRDGIVTTDELTNYTSEALPKLSQLFPQVVMRAGNAPLGPQKAGKNAGAPELEARVKLQAAEVSFPLIELKK